MHLFSEITSKRVYGMRAGSREPLFDGRWGIGVVMWCVVLSWWCTIVMLSDVVFSNVLRWCVNVEPCGV